MVDIKPIADCIARSSKGDNELRIDVYCRTEGAKVRALGMVKEYCADLTRWQMDVKAYFWDAAPVPMSFFFKVSPLYRCNDVVAGFLWTENPELPELEEEASPPYVDWSQAPEGANAVYWFPHSLVNGCVTDANNWEMWDRETGIVYQYEGAGWVFYEDLVECDTSARIFKPEETHQPSVTEEESIPYMREI